MINIVIRNTIFTLSSSVVSSAAIAGGLDRGGVNVDQLFDSNRFGIAGQITYVSPQRSVKNVRRSANVVSPFLPVLITARINQDSSYTVPRLGGKFNLGEGANCLASYSEPYGADSSNGLNNALSATSVDSAIETQDYGLTCSYQFGAGLTKVGDSFVSIVGGVSYQEYQGFLSRQSFLDLANAGITGTVGIVPGGTVTNTSGLGTFNVEGNAVGWRAGIAYEIPDIALRALVIYHSKYDYDLSGIQDNRGFGIADTAPNATAPISLQTEIPQAIEIKLQSGIATDTLAFANFKWQDWSKIDIVQIIGGVDATAAGLMFAIPRNLAFEVDYRDGYTVNLGLGKKLNEQLSSRISIGWDRGTSTTTGSQTDSWTLSGGLNYKENEHIDISIGGAIGLLESGSSSPSPNSIDQANQVSYSFGTDMVWAVTSGIKYKF